MLLFLMIIQSPLQDEKIPYLEKDEFSYEVDYFLKRKPVDNSVIYDTKRRTSDRDMLPYVKLHFTFMEFRETDNRIEVYHGPNRRNAKKIRGPMKITIDMGYAVDMKEGVTDSTFTILIIDSNKEPRAQIHISVLENGELLINEMPSGMI